MTPEEHIKEAEDLLGYTNQDDNLDIHALRIQKAAVHVQIADWKKQYPPDSGRPLVQYPVGQLSRGAKPYPNLPEDHELNRGRPIADNPQA